MPTTLMYIVKPFLGLEAAGQIQVRIQLEAYFDVRTLEWADLVVFCRNVEPRYSYVLDSVLARGLPYIYDIDDNLFEVPAEVSDGEYYRASERTALLTRYLSQAAQVRVYSAALYQRVRSLNHRVCQVDPVLDWNVVQPPSPPKPGSPVKIVYATSRRDDYLFPIFTEALLQVLTDRLQSVQMDFWGFQPEGFRSVPNVHWRKFDPNYNQFMRRFSSSGFEIGLAPMLDDDFHRAKTNTKFREYGACGIAGIYSNVPLYTDWIDNGVTGLLVDNTPGDWHQALVRLIDDPDLRLRLGAAARNRIRQLYSQDHFEQAWYSLITEVLARPRPVLASGSTPSAASDVKTNTQPDPAPSPAAIWRTKAGRATELLGTGQIGRSIFNGRVHLNNLWWLYKINRLKRL